MAGTEQTVMRLALTAYSTTLVIYVNGKMLMREGRMV